MGMSKNETTKKLSDLQVGDIAVIAYYHRHGSARLTPVTITKILPSGKIKTRPVGHTGNIYERTWNSNGCEVGRKYGSESLRSEGETLQDVLYSITH